MTPRYRGVPFDLDGSLVDSLHLILASGRAAGVDTAAALWGPCDREQLAAGRPDYRLETTDQLLALLNVQSMEARRG